MSLLWAVLFVCTVSREPMACEIHQSPAPFTEMAKCKAALQAMGMEAQTRLNVGGFQLIGSCGPKFVSKDEEPS